MITLCKHNECTGCGACFNVCPAGSIAMGPDIEGFLFPSIDAKSCTKCLLCQQACPILSSPYIDRSGSPDIYACWNFDESIRMESSSGGMFTVFANYILENNGVVYGALLDDSQQLKHAAVVSKEELGNFRKSKYFQSDIKDTFREVKKNLNSGRQVFFTGTPCQIAGLYGYIGKRQYPNLLTADFVCHGVPSPLIFKKYQQYQEAKYNSPIRTLSFRDKRIGWSVPEVVINFKDNKIYRKPYIEDLFIRAFIATICLRTSCYTCHYATTKRCGDITLADFWGIGRIEPFDHDTDKGVSLVMLNSEIGRQIFFNISHSYFAEKRALAEAINGNPNLTAPTSRHPDRAAFFADLHNIRFDKLVDKYVPRIGKLRSLVKHILGPNLVIYIRKIKTIVLFFGEKNGKP